MQTIRQWRNIPERYRMEAGQCNKCQEIAFPKRLVCPECGGREFEKLNLSGKGKLTTFTIIRIPPQGFEDLAPYAIGIVELNEGIRVMGQIVDCQPEQLQIGDRLTTQFRRMREDGKTGAICYCYKFVPDQGL